MLTPDDIEHLADDALRVFADLEVAMRSEAARAMLDPLRASESEVRAAITAASASSQRDIERAIADTLTAAARGSLADDETLYAAARLAGIIAPYAGLAESQTMATLISEGIATLNGMATLVRTSAVQAVVADFAAALDSATVAILTGASTPDAAITAAVNAIAKTESKVVYLTAAGDVVEQNIYGAVRRAVLTTAHQTTLRITEARMREVGAEWVEVSAHLGARPEHAEWQGIICRFDELPELTGYGDGAGLGGWNCRHSFSPYFPGIMEPTDTSYLDTPDAEEQYDLSQRQRESERNVRHYSGRAAIQRAGGQVDEAKKSEALARKWRAEASSTAAKRKGFARPDRERPRPHEA